ncbi:hypothetical protein FOL47_010172 [Perkinsus chesapeaki]|uniref:Phosphatase 2A Regulatory Subunit A helical domain-containing protein n=1 Tax=Perkinsus chesapeaki TaxID=330153 RepID=A0A7J6L4P6_PERCH|nr:hypothetical protein FOL47_010172 [Perkinsus chesapeaki]
MVVTNTSEGTGSSPIKDTTDNANGSPSPPATEASKTGKEDKIEIDARFDAVEFFKEELKNEDVSERAKCARRMHLIANHIGPQKTVSILIPVIWDAIQKKGICADDDEVLYAMASSLPNLIPHVDGRYESLVPPLECLAGQDETVIRNTAVQGLVKVAETSDAICQQYCFPALVRLAAGEWFTSRVSACSLAPGIYNHCSEQQKAEIRRIFASLATDESPMVKRAAAQQTRYLFNVVDKDSIVSELLVIHKAQAIDSVQDAIREACVHTTLVLAEKLSEEENRQYTLWAVTLFFTDRSWRVRILMAKYFDRLCQALGPELTTSELLQPFTGLLKDPEQDVRIAAVEDIDKAVTVLSVDQLQSFIVPQFSALARDQSQPVRAALANVIGAVAESLVELWNGVRELVLQYLDVQQFTENVWASFLGFEICREATQKTLLNLILDLMKDEHHTVRLNMVSQAATICGVLGLDTMVSSVLGTVQSLIMDNQWRIRLAVIQQMPKLAGLFGPELFQQKLEGLFLSSLNDSVYSVREAVIDNIQPISEVFGAQWTEEHLLPKIVEQYHQVQGQGYSGRLTTLQALPRLTYVMSSEQVEQHIMPVLVKATKDPVPNVRFTACECLIWMLENHKLDNPMMVTQSLEPTVKDVLAHEKDADVKYIAQKALDVCIKVT